MRFCNNRELVPATVKSVPDSAAGCIDGHGAMFFMMSQSAKLLGLHVNAYMVSGVLTYEKHCRIFRPHLVKHPVCLVQFSCRWGVTLDATSYKYSFARRC